MIDARDWTVIRETMRRTCEGVAEGLRAPVSSREAVLTAGAQLDELHLWLEREVARVGSIR